MKQTGSQPDAAPHHGGPAASLRGRSTLLYSVCAFAVAMALMSEEAKAEGWVESTHYYSGGYTTTFNWLRPGDGQVTHLKEPAPSNNCPGQAFEVLNPKRGEARCVGYVPPYFPP